MSSCTTYTNPDEVLNDIRVLFVDDRQVIDKGQLNSLHNYSGYITAINPLSEKSINTKE